MKLYCIFKTSNRVRNQWKQNNWKIRRGHIYFSFLFPFLSLVFANKNSMSNLFGTQFTRMNIVVSRCIQGIKQMSDFYYACGGLSLKIYSSELTATHTHTYTCKPFCFIVAYPQKMRNFHFNMLFLVIQL